MFSIHIDLAHYSLQAHPYHYQMEARKHPAYTSYIKYAHFGLLACVVILCLYSGHRQVCVERARSAALRGLEAGGEQQRPLWLRVRLCLQRGHSDRRSGGHVACTLRCRLSGAPFMLIDHWIIPLAHFSCIFRIDSTFVTCSLSNRVVNSWA